MAAAPASVFPQESVLAKGKWVKIKIDKTGIYQLTDAQLREMGFDPESISIYGRGGDLQPTQFVKGGEALYTSDLQPVAFKRRNNVTYFYAQDRQKVEYMYDLDAYSDRQRFTRASNQPYADEVVYFITDSGIPKKIPLVSKGTYDRDLSPLTRAWSYSYHEIDSHTIIAGGRDYFGESFLTEDTQTFPYSIPSGVVGSEASITLLFGAKNASSSTVNARLGNTEEVSFTIPAASSQYNYRLNNTKFASTTLPSAEGNVTLSFNGSGATFASLDYMIVGGKRTFAFAPGETQFTVYPYNFKSNSYSGLELPSLPKGSDLGIWQVTNSSEVSELSYYTEGDVTQVVYLADNHRGPVVFLDYSQPQYQILGYEEVANQNLHAIGIDKGHIPAMVIITIPELKSAAERLASLHKEKEGHEVAVVLHDDVVNEFSAGVDDPMAYRAICKMIYDRDDPDNRVFKHLLLFGPNVRDHRNVLGLRPQIGNLISNQVYDTSDNDYTFCMNDWYGMMDDTTKAEQEGGKNSFYQVPMHVSVALIPVDNAELANLMVDKVEHFYSDDSFAYWLTNFNYIAGKRGSTEADNEHLKFQEELYDQMTGYTNNAGIGNKLYNNLNSGPGNFNELLKALDAGSMITYYAGHADYYRIDGDNFLKGGNESNFSNTRQGIALWAACHVSMFDSNQPGVGANMFLLPKSGFVAEIVTSRSCYSKSNSLLQQRFQSALLTEDGSLSGKPLTAPRTLGEAYIIAKNADQSNYVSNKFAYHLFGDPLISLPVPTANVNFSSVADDIYPGSEVEIEGTVTDHSDKLLSNFNGEVVLRLCAPATTKLASSDSNSSNMNVRLDQNTLYLTSISVKAGKFTGKMLVPANTPLSTDIENINLRAAAYDPSSRRGAAGVVKLNVKDFDRDQAVAADMPPVIETLYAGAPDVSENDALPANFYLHADISDDLGVMTYPINGIPSLYATIDGRNGKYDLNNYIRISDEGKSVHLAYPMSLSEGSHIVRLTATDGNGQSVTKNINIKVGGVMQSAPLTAEQEGPARESVTLVAIESGHNIRILDAAGNVKLDVPTQSDRYTWDLKDSNGQRVPSGVYYAIGVKTATKEGTSITEPCEIIVF
ncbi:MAG: C25 family cysteine peptidase [Muribaculaceae bacterium]|nr:C25 family cysteine peptidase [Muribaculaceae bacterium]